MYKFELYETTTQNHKSTTGICALQCSLRRQRGTKNFSKDHIKWDMKAWSNYNAIVLHHTMVTRIHSNIAPFSFWHFIVHESSFRQCMHLLTWSNLYQNPNLLDIHRLCVASYDYWYIYMFRIRTENVATQATVWQNYLTEFANSDVQIWDTRKTLIKCYSNPK